MHYYYPHSIIFLSQKYICVCVCVLSHFSCVQLFVTTWTVAHQSPLSMKLSRQEYWSGLPYSLPGDLPDPGIKPTSLPSPGLAGGFFTTSTTWEAQELLELKGCCWTTKDAGILGLWRKEFNPGPETRIDHSERLCNKVLLKYKREKVSDIDIRRGLKECPLASL